MTDRGAAVTGISRRRALAVGGAALLAVGAGSDVPAIGGADGSRGGGAGNGGTEGAGDGPLARLHAAGHTGAGVDVGVVDPTGFDPGRHPLTDRIAAYEWFGRQSRADGVTHGTAAAAAVARVAPDARLHLAGFDGTDGFVRAAAWCRRRGADLVLAPVAAHGVASPPSAVGRAAARVVADGTAFVAPTGNAARGHWLRPVTLAELTDGDRPPGRIGVEPLSGEGTPRGEFDAWLTHDGPAELNLDLSLFEPTARGDGRNLVALSGPGGEGRGQRLTADLDGADYWLELTHDGEPVVPPERTAVRVAVTTPSHRLRPAEPAGSIASPAAHPAVLGVGAAGPDGGAAAYSGRGPAPTGGPGVDLVAPPRPWVGDGEPGTSAAAARAAGVAALVLGLRRVPPDDLATLLRATAADAGGDGAGIATGAGRLDPELAVQRAAALARE